MGCFHGTTYYYRPKQDSLNVRYTYSKVGQLDAQIQESSGVLLWQDSLLLTHSDSGNLPYLYVTNLSGQFRKKIYIHPAVLLDWEAMCFGEANTLYLADIGNNANMRNQLSVYAVTLDIQKDTLVPYQKIVFYYPEQKHFPPLRSEQKKYDAEAMIYAQGNLYVFTKNRNPKGTDVYRLNPNIKDSIQAAQWLTHSYLDSYVTDATYNPQNQELTLLTYGFLYRYRSTLDSNFFRDAQLTVRHRIPLSQTEAITYDKNHNFWMTNEKGKLFQVNLTYKKRFRWY